MATGGHSREITNRQYVNLGSAISRPNMESIALGYLNIEQETIDSLKVKHREDIEAFNRDILRTWAYKTAVPDQVKALASILYKAGAEHAYVNPKKIKKALGVSIETEAELEEEFMMLAEHLRPWTEKAMKIEVAPWIREYVVDMDELYTELTLEKAEYKLDGEQCKVLESYKEVLEDHKEAPHVSIYEDVEIKSVQHLKKKNETRGQKGFKNLLPCVGKYDHGEARGIEKIEEGKKILFKGEPGMGKTTVGKKIGWDWAKGILKTFEIIFFVFLKFVRPGYSIENTIIQQTPVLTGLGITASKLLTFFEKFGNKCLLILDGFDECALGQNQDVVEIVRGEKLFKCNILLTSRPHSTREITEHFQTVVKVTGFTQDQARKFALKILNDEELVDDVMSFTPPTLIEEDTKLYQCPILLSFLCLLVRENEISLSDKAIGIGEIYTRMVRCLYGKFSIRKNRSFDATKFVDTLKRIGKIAFTALLSGNPLLKRSDVIEVVDEEVFDYGLLIGYEDAYRLIPDETADIFITFPHRSIMEFLGALYFVLQLSSDTTIDTLLDENKSEPIFMTDQLFLDFCLWFLCDKNSYIPIAKKDVILTTLAGFCAQKLVSSCLYVEHVHLEQIAKQCPTLDLRRAEKKNDGLMLAFHRKFLEKFENVNTIVLDFIYRRQWILEAMVPNCENIKHINIKGVFSYFACTRNCTIKVFMKKQGQLPECLDHLITKGCLNFNKPSTVQFFQKGHRSCDLAAASIIPFGRFITHLYAMSCSVSKAQLKLLADAITQSQIPRLSHLGFISCEFVTLSPLTEISWPNLSHLTFHSCDLGRFKCMLLAEVVSYKLTNLTSLAVVDQHVEHFLDTIFKHGTVGMTQFFLSLNLRNYKTVMSQLHEAASNKKMPNLLSLSLMGIEDFSPLLDLMRTLPLQSMSLSTLHATKYNLTQLCREFLQLNLRELNLSDYPNVKGYLSELFSDSFPSLHTLSLRKCKLGSYDLRCLAQANAKGVFPKLKCLDISLNRGHLDDIFPNYYLWNQLVSLNILHTFQQWGHDLLPHSFKALQHLSVSDQACYALFSKRVFWQCLQNLHIFMLDEQTMSHIVNAQERHLLPALESLCVNLDNVERSVFDIDATHRLGQISVHDAESFRDDFSHWGCVCCEEGQRNSAPRD